MKEKLPVYLENRSLPRQEIDRKDSYGYASIMYILSIIITLGTIISIFVLGNR